MKTAVRLREAGKGATVG